MGSEDDEEEKKVMNWILIHHFQHAYDYLDQVVLAYQNLPRIPYEQINKFVHYRIEDEELFD